MDRRRFLWIAGGILGNGLVRKGEMAAGEGNAESFFRSRGVVISPDDLTLPDWPERAKNAGLTTIGLHHLSKVVQFVKTGAGQAFLEKCRNLGLEVEYELHAMSNLLPRGLFNKDKNMFRMNEDGERIPDYNLCVHSENAVESVCENAVKLSSIMRPTTGRYFYWIDDGRPMCHCKSCRGLSYSDQALILENRIVKALRRIEPNVSLAHLAYLNTLNPPEEIKPEDGIFLEFAPIGPKDKFIPKTDEEWNKEATALDGNLQVFGNDTAHILEYWLDVSMWSNWKGRPNAVPLPWDERVFAQDLDFYGSRGVRSVTTFAVYMDADYIKKYGEPPLDEYGQGLRAWRSE